MINMEGTIQSLIDFGIKYGLKLIGAVLILAIGFWLAKRVTRSFKAVMERRNVDLSLRSFLSSLINISLKILTVVIVLTSVGVEMTSIIAILGAASLAVGMALSGTMQNFAGGVIILLLKPFKVGDVIETQSGYTGTVGEIYIFTTLIHTADNKTVYVPNGVLANGSITNYTKEGTRRLDINLSIAYGDDVDKARQVLLDIIAQDARILKEPAQPTVFLSKLDSSSVNITARLWVKADDLFAVQCDLNERAYEIFPKQGLSFPFPQLQVHMSK